MKGLWKPSLQLLVVEKLSFAESAENAEFFWTDLENVPGTFDSLSHNDPDRGSYSTPCYFYSMVTRKCLIHENKPQVCRDFQAGGPDCLRLREKYLIAIEMFEQILDEE